MAAATLISPSTPRLSEVCRRLVVPEGIVTSVFPMVERRLRDVGVRFDEWQRGFGSAALGCREDGKFAASIGGVGASIPRQVGKTFTVGNLLIGLALEFPELRAAWTSHHNRTTTNTFRSMQGMVRKPKLFPLLAPNGIRTTNGEQEIRFGNGSLIMFGAREQGFGRGLDAIDVEVFDEAQILTHKALEDMIPATNQARNPHGGLIFFLGTPPRPADPGEAFTLKREQALSGRSEHMMYVEIGAEPGVSPDDRAQWGRMNPSFPHRTSLEAMLRMRANMPDEDSYRREAMGIWDESAAHVPVVKPARWAELRGAGPGDGVKPSALAVDMSHSREVSIAGSWLGDSSTHLEEVWAGADAGLAVEWIAERAGRRMPVVVDSMSPAASLVPVLRARKVNVRVTGAADMARACGLFDDGVKSGSLSHAGQESLMSAVVGAKKRAIRDAGGWGWDRRDPSSVIHPLVAVSLALLGAAESGKRSRSGGATFA